MKILVLRFDAPLISLGAPIIDNYGKVQEFPALSMLVGLIGNALGYDHLDYDKLNLLQKRISFVARQELPGKKIMDYQTVDLKHDFMNMKKMGWTTWNGSDSRKGGPASKGTHIRYRYYFADSIITVFITLIPEDEEPTTDQLLKALRKPERPLFIGRKCCIPSSPILANEVQHNDLLQAMREYPLYDRKNLHEYTDKKKLFAQWFYEKEKETSSSVSIMDKRDWKNQIHCGERLVRQGNVTLEGEKNDG